MRLRPRESRRRATEDEEDMYNLGLVLGLALGGAAGVLLGIVLMVRVLG
jgi:hypothetical protein